MALSQHRSVWVVEGESGHVLVALPTHLHNEGVQRHRSLWFSPHHQRESQNSIAQDRGGKNRATIVACVHVLFFLDNSVDIQEIPR